jgi:uncharacterized membrane protein
LITLLILNYLIGLLTQPFIGMSEYFLDTHFNIDPMLILLTSEILILVILTLFLITLGFFAHLFIKKSLFSIGDRFMTHIPLANLIYKTVQELLKNFLEHKESQFSQPVLVTFPNSPAQAIGFIMREALPFENSDKALISVLIPGTPNPMMGFVLKLPKDQITPLNIPKEKAIKFVISCGALLK